MQQFSQNSLSRKYEDTIEPFFRTHLQRGIWKTADAVDLVYYSVSHPQAKALIVLSAGRSEAALKYAELIYDLYHAGYSIFIHDHRGQGESSRLSENPHHGYVGTFNDYVDDYQVLIKEVITPWLNEHQQSDLPRHLMCHSMGGAIGALLVLQERHFFSKLILCSPMFGISAPLPLFIAKALLAVSLYISKLQGKKASYFIGGQDYKASSFDKNRLTHCPIRYQVLTQVYAEHPQIQLGGVTSQWLQTSIQAMNYIVDTAQHIQLPVLCLYSGEEMIVSNDDTKEVIAKIDNAQSMEIEGAMHELLFETDEIRTRVLHNIQAFIEA